MVTESLATLRNDQISTSDALFDQQLSPLGHILSQI